MRKCPCYECSFTTHTNVWLKEREALDKKARELYDVAMVMRPFNPPIRRKRCQHNNVINRLRNAEGRMYSWCGDCGETIKNLKSPITEKREEHELDVVQRLSRLYWENIREIKERYND